MLRESNGVDGVIYLPGTIFSLLRVHPVKELHCCPSCVPVLPNIEPQALDPNTLYTYLCLV